MTNNIKNIEVFMKRFLCCLLFGILFIPISLLAQQQAQVFEGGRIIPIEGEPISEGILVVEEGKISAIGEQGTVSIPDGAQRHDVSGKVIMPGLVDSHSHIGSGDGGDRSSALHPDTRILDSIDPRSDTFKKALAGGITTVNVMPGSGHLMSGQTAYLKLRDANTIEDMLFVDDPLNEIAGGLKMANGTNPIGDSPFPGTRAKSAAMVRDLFIQAQEYSCA
jgi:imidazolonepropionase-like amidohydrolase